jgi:hypothetical protein
LKRDSNDGSVLSLASRLEGWRVQGWEEGWWARLGGGGWASPGGWAEGQPWARGGRKRQCSA